MSDVDMNAVLARSQALSIDALGKAFISSMQRREMMADRTFDELDLEQTIASRYSTATRFREGNTE